MNFAKFLKTCFLQNTSGQLFLKTNRINPFQRKNNLFRSQSFAVNKPMKYIETTNCENEYYTLKLHCYN